MSTVSLPDIGTMQMQNAKQGELQKEFAMRRLQEQLKNAPDKEAKLKEACKGFESIFLGKLWKQMRDSVPKEGFLHSKEEEMYLGMFDQKLSEQLADAGGIGLGDMLFNNLKANMLDASRVTSPSNAKERLPIKPLNRHFNPRDIDPPSDAVKMVSTEKTDPNAPLYEPLEGYEGADAEEAGAQNQDAQNQDSQNLDAQYLDAQVLKNAATAMEKPGEEVVDFDEPLPEEKPVAARVEETPDVAASFGVEEESLRNAKWTAANSRATKVSGNSLETDAEVISAVDNLAKLLQPPLSPVTSESPRNIILPQSQSQLPPPASALPQNEGASASFPNSLTLGKGKLSPDAGQRFDFGIDLQTESVAAAEQPTRTNEGGPEPTRAEPVSAATVEALAQAHKASGASTDAPLHWPVDGRISSGFGWRKSPFTGERTFHSGVDIAARRGDPVEACWDGQVIFSGLKDGYGRVVIVEHAGGWQSYYGHNSKNNVNVGDTVRAGEKIASIGSTGRSTGPHLHFELRRDGLAWDPEKIQQRLAAGKPAVGNA